MSGRPLRVAVLSPHPIVTEGLRTLLGTMDGRVEHVRLDDGAPDPDVVLYDAIGLLPRDRTDFDLLVGGTTARVLVISRELNPGLAALALASGADGHFPMGANREQILEAIESAGTAWRHGDGGDSPVVGSSDSTTGKDLAGVNHGLSQRELQILGMIGRGRLNTEIAEEFHLSPNTVKTYIRNAYRKIGVSTRAQATGWAITHGVAAEARDPRVPTAPGRGGE